MRTMAKKTKRTTARARRKKTAGRHKTVRTAAHTARKRSSRKTSRTTARRKIGARKTAGRKWSQRVTNDSDALDLQGGVFTWKDPKRIAASLKRSAEQSHRRKADPFRSSLSMLTFYINRAGHNLGAAQKRVLTRAKDELRKQFGRA
jgi:hypothetical protein